MKKLLPLTLLLLLCSLAFGQGMVGNASMVGTSSAIGGINGSAPSPIVQDGAGCSAVATTGTTLSCGSLTVTAGDLITCQSAPDNPSGGSVFVSVSDTTNGIYLVPQYQNNPSSAGSHVNVNSDVQAYFPNAAGGTYSPTLTVSGTSDGMTISCQAWKNARTSAALDGGAINQYQLQFTGASNPTSGSAQTPTANGELITCIVNTSSNTPTAGLGYSLITGGSSQLVWSETEIQTTATATNCPFTMASDNWMDYSTAYLPSSASAGVTPITGIWNNASGGSNGVAPTSTTVGNSGAFTIGPYPTTTWNVTNTNSDLTYASSPSFSNCMQNSVWINGASYSPTSSGLIYQFATGTGGDGVNFASNQAGYNSAAEVYCFETDLPQTDSSSHFYSLGTIESADATDYCDPQIEPNGTNLTMALESPEGTVTSITFATSTVYEIVMTYATNAGGCTLKMYNSSWTQVGSTLSTSTHSGSHPAKFFGFAGTSGAEAETSGYHIWTGYFRASVIETPPL